ncbi:MAG: hypothetical protein VX643_00995, partial [Chloroflexota bacterium]|nr:hypothetical protein [Chloroflexota bacterium]
PCLPPAPVINATFPFKSYINDPLQEISILGLQLKRPYQTHIQIGWESFLEIGCLNHTAFTSNLGQ